MIKLKSGERTIRETSCKFQYNEGGELKTDDLTIRYFSPTVAESKADQAEIERVAQSDTEVLWISDLLVKRLHSLPNLCDEKGEPHEITREFLEGLDMTNLRAISDAIRKDLAPKSEGTK